MLVELSLHPVTDPEILKGSAHRSHGGRLENLDVGLHRERYRHLASIVERNDGKAIYGIKLTNLALDQRSSPPPAIRGKHSRAFSLREKAPL